jgi:competence protein ComEC
MVLRMKAGDVVGLSQPKTDLENARISAADAKTDSEEDKLLWSITCLSPEADLLSGDKNQDSMVLRLQYGDFSMLFTGDLEEEAEVTLAESGENLRSDVLKVGHHGSKKASSESFLAVVSPQIAVISCGKDNRYGHPAPDTVNRLMEAGCMIWQTQESGAVTLQSDGRTYTVNGAIG